MSPERRQQIAELLQNALRREASERTAFLDRACAGDEELRKEVEARLASHEQANQLSGDPVAAKQRARAASLAGQTVAHYQVLSLLGSGGMGDVYLALDTKLGRKVALKLLPEYLASDPQRTRQFTKEARAASALNHPNIVTIHEIGQLGDRYYIAMEHVDGETLRSHIYGERTPLSKLLKYLKQVAEGLTKAHANGIVHRDLKPDNIMITRDGYAKILDFGLAKLVEPSQSADLSDLNEAATALMAPTSIPGMVIGTIGYMSPEQAQGKSKEIDHRSDIFSFGCILFEAATGTKAFAGVDVLDSLHKIVHSPAPQISDVNPNTPPDLERIVRRCLAKDPEKRYQSVKDVAIELDELRQQLKDHPQLSQATGHITDTGVTSTPLHTATAEPTTSPASSAEYLAGEIKRHKRGVAIALAVAVIAIAGLAFAIYKFWPRTAPAPKLTKLTSSGKASEAAISPDGKFVAYVVTEAGQQSIRLGLVDNPASSTVLFTSGKVSGLFTQAIIGLDFAPDGKSIFFRVANNPDLTGPAAGYALYQVPVLGSPAKKLMDKTTAGSVISADAKQIAFGRREDPEMRLYVADVGGGNERLIATRKLPQLILPAAWSPDGRILACISTVGDGTTTGNIVFFTLADGSERQLTPVRGWFFRSRMKWLPDGSGLVFSARDQQQGVDQLWHLSYPGGELLRITNTLSSYVGVSITADAGALVTTEIDRPLNIWVLPEGDSSRGKPITSGKHFIAGLSWTMDDRIVYATGDTGPKQLSVLAADGTAQQTLLGGDDSDAYVTPSVSPDGQTILFVSRERVGRMNIDGSNQKLLTTSPPSAQLPQMTPDGQWVIYSTNDSLSPTLFKVPANGGEPVQISRALIWRHQISPDGSKIGCLYRESADQPYKIAILPLDGGPPVKVFDLTSNIDRILRWSNDGRALYYTDEREGVSNIWRLPVESGPPTKVTKFTDGLIRSFAWSRDGKLLAVSRGTQTSDVVLITGFK